MQTRKASPLLVTALLGALYQPVSAENETTPFDLLEQPARFSHLVSRSVTMDIYQGETTIFASGERGHILSWQDKDDWQQHKVPVSTAITGITQLASGAKVAVGHDSVVLVTDKGSDEWRKVFDGYQLIALKQTFIESQIQSVTDAIANAGDDIEAEELEYQLEELEFALEDLVFEAEDGPNKPLLSVTSIGDKVFASGAYGTLLLSEDQGQTWQLVDNRLPNPEGYHLNKLQTADENTLYIAGESGTLFKSSDQGETWQQLDVPYGGSLFGVEVNQSNPEQLVAFGLQGNFILSADGGDSWQPHNINSSASFLGGTFGNNNKVYLVGHGGLIASFDFDQPQNLTIKKHPSGAAFAAVVEQQNSLILAGQMGITRWQGE